jgi:hypothetical protein
MLSRSLQSIVRFSFSRFRAGLAFLVCVLLAIVLTRPLRGLSALR